MGFFSIIIWAIIVCPLLAFFLVIRRFKRPSVPLDYEARSSHFTKARVYFAISAISCLATFAPVFLIFIVKFLGKAHWKSEPLIVMVLVGVPICVIATFVTAALGVKHARLADMSTPRVLAQMAIVVIAHVGFLGELVLLLAGMGWGRPLRVAGKILKPSLREGDDWVQGERPDAMLLDEATRRALEALWLHDAKKEYASVPAFSRLGWQLAALAAPPELLRDVHIAALQEIEHARKCFALAAGFGGRAQTALPMPEMLKDVGAIRGNPFIHVAVESLSDGCLLEGFNADIAQRSAEICCDSVSLKVIRQIAREERSHAELSWRILAFCYEEDPQAVGIALRKEMAKLAVVQRPTASSSQNMPIVQAADPQWLIKYGRLPDEEFDLIWRRRMQDTEKRLMSMLNQETPSVSHEIMDVFKRGNLLSR